MRRICAATLGLCLAISVAQARGPYGSISVGNWHGGAYTNDDDGDFSHYAAMTVYALGQLYQFNLDQRINFGASKSTLRQAD